MGALVQGAGCISKRVLCGLRYQLPLLEEKSEWFSFQNFVTTTPAREVSLRAAPPPPGRARTAPHAKLLARRGFMGQRPQLRVHTSKLYGKMMWRLIETECRQVCELQYTKTVHRDETYKAHRRFRARKRGGHRRLAKRERQAPQAKPPAGWGFGGRAPNYNSKQNLDEYFHVTRAHFQDAGGFPSTAR